MVPFAYVVPGPPEFAVIVLIAVLVFGVPLVIAGGLYLLYRNRNEITEARIRELEETVESLEDGNGEDSE